MAQYSNNPLHDAHLCAAHDAWLNTGMPDDGPDTITEDDVLELWKTLDLTDWDERTTNDRVDTYCVERCYSYVLREGVFYVTALDVLPDDNFAEILCVEFSDGINYFDITRAIKTKEITERLTSDGWKETHGSDGDYDIVKSPYSNFLKSLRPQPSWKPSEEQMEALWEVEGRMRTNKTFTLSNRLASLYNDLQKLM